MLFQVSSAAQRFLERELAVSHSSSWRETLTKLDSVYDQLIDCYLNDRKRNDRKKQLDY